MGGVAPADRGLSARGHHPDLRLRQHDRRGVRSMKHLIPEFEALRARFPPASSRRWCCPACGASRKSGATSPTATSTGSSSISASRASRSRRCSRSTRSSGASRSAGGTSRSAATCRARCAARSGSSTICAAGSASRPGETTADGRFTLSTVECLGSCGTAPVVMVNDTYHENMSREARRAPRALAEHDGHQAPHDLPGHRHLAHARRYRARGGYGRSRRRSRR